MLENIQLMCLMCKTLITRTTAVFYQRDVAFYGIPPDHVLLLVML